MKTKPPLPSRAATLFVAALCALTLTTTLVRSAQAQTQPPPAPILRIEMGMHNNTINRIGVDAANRFLVTASDDKTARVWELPSGNLLRVLRPPVGAGNEGKLYAVAISPDGRTIATAGWTKAETGAHNIYLFDRESGRLVRRVGGLPNVVFHLAYSHDGRYLAATLFSVHGVHVYQTQEYSLVGQDKDYSADTYSAEFDRAGRLVTSSHDGFVRLYEPPGEGGLRLLAKRKLEGGERPFAARFSPDGSRIAVGFDDSAKVAVLSSRDLSLLYAPVTTGAGNGNLFSVTWSEDGRTLYAGGTAQTATGICFIRAWAEGGRGGYRDTAAAEGTVMHSLPLKGGGIVYGTGEPSFGVIDAGGRRTLFVGASVAKHRGLRQDFLISPDSTGVQFGYELVDRTNVRFSLAERKLTEVQTSAAAGWRAPVTVGEGLHVTGWEDAETPMLNGVRLPINNYEFSRALAIVPGAGAFLLGTEWYLRLFDRDGKPLWAMPVPAPATTWAVNVSADGRLVVGAFGDGTIRWYSLKDGAELLAFFPHADRKRWVLWTPSGYYDASPGGEELIGWQVNNGPDKAADFVPVSQFREAFYRPDVVAKVLETLDEGLALKGANDEAGRRSQEADVMRQRPPVVELLSPADGAQVASSEVTLRFRVRAPSGEPVTALRALVDGRPDPDAAEHDLNLAAGAGGVERVLRVRVPEQGGILSVIAENRFGASSPATTRVSRASSTQQIVRDVVRTGGADTVRLPLVRPNLYVLAIGVSDYDLAELKLHYAAKDARDFVAAMKLQEGGLYERVETLLLTDKEATRDRIMDGLEWITGKTTSKDVAMVFFAGHGVNDNQMSFYFLPVGGDPDKLWRTGVAYSDFERAVQALVGKTLFFVDACHSGGVFGPRRRDPFAHDITKLINDLASAETGAIVFASSTGRQPSVEDARWENGAFTEALLEGIGGGAAVRDSYITVSSLNKFIVERVNELTRGRQKPVLTFPAGTMRVEDYPMALKR
ncbi:MAG TPA: caspase family protein [Pyrinomonadaceae bacterium]|nr:caspase family protein [Pyrinomonadaceae bacterium]